MMKLARVLLRATAVAASVVTFGAGQADAQNWDGNHQVRAGFYLQSARNGYGVTGGLADESIGHHSWGFGASGGLEWLRAGMLSLGAEIDVAAVTGNAKLSAPNPAVKFGSEYFASIRGRLGVHFNRDFMIYGTAGWGALGTEADIALGSKVSATNTGGVYGGGLEWHRGNAILFAEYLHGNFGNRTANILGTNYTYNADTNAVRLGVKFKLGHDWRDDVRGHEVRRDHDPLK